MILIEDENRALFMRSYKPSVVSVLYMERMPCTQERGTFPNADLKKIFFQTRMHGIAVFVCVCLTDGLYMVC